MEYRAVFGAEREPGLLRRAGLAVAAAVAFHALLAGVMLGSSGGAPPRADQPKGGVRSLQVELVSTQATEAEASPVAPAPDPPPSTSQETGSSPETAAGPPAVEAAPPPAEAEPPTSAVAPPPAEAEPTPSAAAPPPEAAPVQRGELTGRFPATGETTRRSTPPTREILRYTAPQYPEASRRRGETGTVEIEVTVDRRGRVTDHRVVASSGVAALDRAAIRAIRLWRFPRGSADRLSRHRIDFVLEESP